MGGYKGFFTTTKSWFFVASLGPFLRSKVTSCQYSFIRLIPESFWQNDPSSGTFKGNQGDGQTVNVYGFAVATVNEKLQIQTIEIYYDQAEFIKALQHKTAGMIL